MFELAVFLQDRLVGRSTFEDDEVRVGRSADNEVQIDNLALSRYHASIERLGELYVLKDFGTPSGTWLNGQRIAGRASLDDGDRIGLGKFTLVFRRDKKAEAEVAQVRDEAAYAVAGKTMASAGAEGTRERTCPFVGFLQSDEDDPSVPARIVTLHREFTVAGSDASCELRLDSGPARAAVIVRGWQGFALVALAPVSIDGTTVEVKALLKDGVLLGFGGTRFRFRLGRPESGP